MITLLLKVATVTDHRFIPIKDQSAHLPYDAGGNRVIKGHTMHFYRGFKIPERPKAARVCVEFVADEVLVRANREGFAWLASLFSEAAKDYDAFRHQRLDPADMGGVLESGSRQVSIDHIELAEPADDPSHK